MLYGVQVVLANRFKMEQYVYVESTKSMAFQFLKFESKEKAEFFCKSVMASCETLKAKLVECNDC